VLISGSIVRPLSLRDHALCPPPQLPLLAVAAPLHIHLWWHSASKGQLEADVPCTAGTHLAARRSALPPALSSRTARRARSALATGAGMRASLRTAPGNRQAWDNRIY